MSDAKISGGTITLPVDDYLALASERDALAAVAEAARTFNKVFYPKWQRGNARALWDAEGEYGQLRAALAAYDRTVAKP